MKSASKFLSGNLNRRFNLRSEDTVRAFVRASPCLYPQTIPGTRHIVFGLSQRHSLKPPESEKKERLLNDEGHDDEANVERNETIRLGTEEEED